MDKGTHPDKLAGAAQSVVSEGLHTVEEAVNTAIDSTKDVVHELRNDATEAVDQTIGRTIGRVKDTLDKQRPRFEQYISSHPWIALGSLLVLWYLLTGKRRVQP
ncbi:MAG: hypothetical protein A4E19_13865 [Nitrospira sp. SG-bin1]|nr:MAG: hypothetical protein A4E19_13865 [Nitrospira sp. SG-bin1]